MVLICSASLLASLLAFLLWERRARDRALAAVPIRIHVNGTRGKSTVTRLIAAALREAGVRTVAKTTGTAPRLILPDGCERPVRRRAPASIREQLWVLREASRLEAQAAVIECMAVDPDLQAVCEDQMIRATIGVITNARRDHAEVMGDSVEAVALALASTVPRRAVLVIGPTDGGEVLARVAASRGSRVVHGAADAGGPGAWDGRPWMAEDAGIALAVARELGIPDDIARRGMLAAAPDPGALRSGSLEVAGRRIGYVDATAVNDPQSLGVVLGGGRSGAVFVFHHRADRPARLGQFSDVAPWSLGDDAVVVTGDRPDLATWRRLRAHLPGARASFTPRHRLAADLRRRLSAPTAPPAVVFCGNTKGIRVDAIVDAIGQG
ncbi:MAG: poly-gamma-glutamate synthase PgsB [Vicinamibacterales bacterium]